MLGPAARYRWVEHIPIGRLSETGRFSQSCSVNFFRPGITHEEMVQESKRHWQRLEQNAQKQQKVRFNLSAIDIHQFDDHMMKP